MYAVRGSKTSPFGALGFAGGATRGPVCAPPSTQLAIKSSSRTVSCRLRCPTNGFESRPGGQGGITCACVIALISCACARASLAVASENGAMPPTVWQPTHLLWKIGATSAYVAPGPPLTAVARARHAPHTTSTARSRRINHAHSHQGDREASEPLCYRLEHAAEPAAVHRHS